MIGGIKMMRSLIITIIRAIFLFLGIVTVFLVMLEGMSILDNFEPLYIVIASVILALLLEIEEI